MDNIIIPTRKELEQENRDLRVEVAAGRELALLLLAESADGRLRHRIEKTTLGHALKLAQELSHA